VVAACSACTRPGASVAPAGAVRTVRLSRALALAGIDERVEIREISDGRVLGLLEVSSGDVNRRSVEENFGCRTRRVSDPDTNIWSCRVSFIRGEPAWRDLLHRLDSLGIMRPSRDSVSPGGPQWLCMDGAPWVLLVQLDGIPVPAVRERQSCGRMSPTRAAFETGIDSTISGIISRGYVRADSSVRYPAADRRDPRAWSADEDH
jgi:hypothetical protein